MSEYLRLCSGEREGREAKDGVMRKMLSKVSLQEVLWQRGESTDFHFSVIFFVFYNISSDLLVRHFTGFHDQL